ncbi:MAG: hypothetical protein Q3965_02325 [Rothia sp. (in: high G+C Gram-positive bacteria)]|nr:hypothetical protein [Rothia sp. (in: high G+C Gram-positive bacteria)]
MKLAQKKGASCVPVLLLESISDIFEGKLQRAVSVYQRALSEPTLKEFYLDAYAVYAFLSYLASGQGIEVSQPLSDEEAEQVAWFFSPLASAIYRSKVEPSNLALNELGHIADSLINEPGTKQFVAVILRALQGNRLLERGEYLWAERVLSYTSERAGKLMNFNKPLLDAIERDRAVAQEGVARISYQ